MKLDRILAAFFTLVLVTACLTACGTPALPATATTAAVPAVSTATQIENGLLTAENILQQFNTGLQTVAPTVDTILTLTHNQGDAAAVNNVATQSAAMTPALTTLLSAVNTAIKASTPGASQIAAVNAALSPATAAAIAAPVAAANP
jgi:hypothetical protein